MKALATAIRTRGVATSAFNTAIGGRLYYVDIIQPPTFPCVVFFFPKQTKDNLLDAATDSKQVIHDFLVQFNIHTHKDSVSDYQDNLYTIAGYLTSQFDNYTFSVTGYGSQKMIQTNEFGPYPVTDDQKEWVYGVEYTIALQKTS